MHVVLDDEGVQHRPCDLILPLALAPCSSVFHVGREISSIAQVTTTPNHGQIHAGTPTLNGDGQHINVSGLDVLHRLLVQYL